MTASEFAFLALGLVLGVASGSALVMVLGSRPPARMVRVTMERDAVPRRAATLSSDAFVTATAEPARGGPADRRHIDRDGGWGDVPPPPAPFSPILAAAAPAPNHRTTVSFGNSSPAVSAIPIAPERDPALDALRVQAALAAERLYRTGTQAATAVLEERAEPAALAAPPSAAPALAAAAFVLPAAPFASGVATPHPLGEPGPDDEAPTTAVIRILRGDHQALIATTAALAGADAAERRPWHAALMGLARSLSQQAIRAGWLDVPVGNPFWDTFTIGQCRQIAAALASAGYVFDGTDGWAEGRIPAYRDLAMAVATAGLEPRRIRAWPTQDEIALLYREVTVATDDFLASHAPTMDLEEIQDLVGEGGPERARLWSSWDRVRSALLEPAA